MSTRYFPGGQPLFGFSSEKLPLLSPSRVSVFSSILLLAAATAPTSSASQTARILSPSSAPLVLKRAKTFAVSGEKVELGSSSSPLARTAFTFTSAPAAPAVIIAAKKKRRIRLISLRSVPVEPLIINNFPVTIQSCRRGRKLL